MTTIDSVSTDTTDNPNIKNFKICGLGYTTGNLIHSYISIDSRVLYAGIRVDRSSNLIISVHVKEGEDPTICLTDAIEQCKSDVDRVSAVWDQQN